MTSQECHRCGAPQLVAGAVHSLDPASAHMPDPHGHQTYPVTCPVCGWKWDALSYVPPVGRIVHLCVYCRAPLVPWPEPHARLCGVASVRCPRCDEMYVEAVPGEVASDGCPEALRVRRA